MEQKIELGSIGRDTITGFTGVVTARTEWLFGCTRFCLEPQGLRDGVPVESQWFDEQRISVIDNESSPIAEALQATINEAIGGPHDDPQRRKDYG